MLLHFANFTITSCNYSNWQEIFYLLVRHKTIPAYAAYSLYLKSSMFRKIVSTREGTVVPIIATYYCDALRLAFRCCCVKDQVRVGKSYLIIKIPHSDNTANAYRRTQRPFTITDYCTCSPAYV